MCSKGNLDLAVYAAATGRLVTYAGSDTSNEVIQLTNAASGVGSTDVWLRILAHTTTSTQYTIRMEHLRPCYSASAVARAEEKTDGQSSDDLFGTTISPVFAAEDAEDAEDQATNASSTALASATPCSACPDNLLEAGRQARRRVRLAYPPTGCRNTQAVIHFCLSRVVKSRRSLLVRLQYTAAKNDVVVVPYQAVGAEAGERACISYQASLSELDLRHRWAVKVLNPARQSYQLYMESATIQC